MTISGAVYQPIGAMTNRGDTQIHRCGALLLRNGIAEIGGRVSVAVFDSCQIEFADNLRADRSAHLGAFGPPFAKRAVRHRNNESARRMVAAQCRFDAGHIRSFLSRKDAICDDRACDRRDSAQCRDNQRGFCHRSWPQKAQSYRRQAPPAKDSATGPSAPQSPPEKEEAA